MTAMKRQIWMRRLALPAVVIVFLAVVWMAQRILMPKYQGAVIEGNFTEEYYRDPTHHDLLIIGNCESYENISTMELWRQFGITSYIRGNANQLIPQSYYMLMDALEYETPKAVLLNIQAMMTDGQDTEEYNRMVFDGMRWGRNKWDGIRSSAMEDEEMAEYLFPIFRYHARWSDLDGSDLTYAFRRKPLTSFNGYYLRADVRPADEFPAERRRRDYTFPEINSRYLDEIRKACEERNIQLILMKAPSLYPEWPDACERQILDYAETYDLPYYNFLELAETVGLDMSEDTYDAGLHLNVYGAEKVSDYLGVELVNRFGFGDHRQEVDTAAWYQERLDAYDREKSRQAAEFAELGYIRRFQQEE